MKTVHVNLDDSYLKAKVLFEEEKYHQAIQVINKVLAEEPSILSLLMLKTLSFKKLGKINSAKRVLVELIKVDLSTKETRYDWKLLRKQFYEDSLIFIEPIVHKNLKDPIPIETKGKLLGILEKYDELVDFIDWTYTIEPRNHSAPIFKEYVLYRLGKRSDPTADIDMIIKKTRTKNKKVLAFRDKTVQEIMEMESLKKR